VAFCAWSVVSAAGCATLSGLDQIGENDCVPNCDASVPDDGHAGTADTGSTMDSSQPNDATADGAADGSEGPEAPADASSYADVTAEASGEDASDAPTGADVIEDHDAAQDARGDGSREGGGDAGSEADACGPTNTVTNCGACGKACAAPSMSVATASCAGTACAYTCQPGHLDCNAGVAPNTDGCECPTPGVISATCCPSNACPTQHVTGFPSGQTGLDQTFYDCSTTITEQVALDACNAYAGMNAMGESQCQTNQEFGSPCANNDLVVCNFLAPAQNCVCWAYGGAAGWAINSNSITQCLCPAGQPGLGEIQYH
jgi:hypothetical protein